MARVYRHHPGPDDYVGRVEKSGRVYGQRFGPDEYLGRVEKSGRVYAHEPGPDHYLGRVEDSGTIYRHVPGGADENVGRVETDDSASTATSAKIYSRRPGIAPDRLIGRVEGDPLILAGGAAFFLLLSGLE